MTIQEILNRKPFIISEVGSNWSSLDDCYKSIQLAKASGADAVKFQLFDQKALYGHDLYEKILTADYKILQGPVKKMPGQLHIEWLPSLKQKSDACGIEFMCSAFSPELVEAVDPYCNIHKVASCEMTHVRILEKLRHIGKPVILSTGAQHPDDITVALKILGDTPVILMYCVAEYPARYVHLELMDDLFTKFDKPVGFSDHTTDVCVIPRHAVKMYGAAVLEKHFNAVEHVGPDSPHSLNVQEFRDMVESIRMPSSKRLGPTFGETPMVLRHKRRIKAIKNINVGETLIEGENFGIYRSLRDDMRAASPFMINELTGRKTKKSINAGEGIWIDDLE